MEGSVTCEHQYKLCSVLAQLCEDVAAESMPLPLVLSFGDIEKDSSTEKCFYLRAHRVGNRNIIVKVGQLELAHDCAGWQALVLEILNPWVVVKRVCLCLIEISSEAGDESEKFLPDTGDLQMY